MVDMPQGHVVLRTGLEAYNKTIVEAFYLFYKSVMLPILIGDRVGEGRGHNQTFQILWLYNEAEDPTKRPGGGGYQNGDSHAVSDAGERSRWVACATYAAVTGDCGRYRMADRCQADRGSPCRGLFRSA